MEVINVVEQGSVIKKTDIQFCIYKEGVLNERIPYFKVDKIVLWGNQTVTTAAFNLAFEKGIDIIFLSLNGRFRGKVVGKTSKNIYVRLAQYELWRDLEERLKISKIVIRGKTNNQIKLLKAYGINTDSLKENQLKIDNANDIKELMGIEGIISKDYFSAFSNIIRNEQFIFNGRNRRPPKDEVNAMLSLTYSLVLSRIIMEMESIGLDTYLGFLHSVKYGREALALDILEEFRQGFADRFVIKLINRKEFKKGDFISTDEDGYRFTEVAFRKYLLKFNKEFEKIEPNIKKQVNGIKNYILLNENYVTYSG